MTGSTGLHVTADPANRIQKTVTSRAHHSCDRCRSRKTKCIDPIPGPCRYCARTGSSCGVVERRKKRPFYHVTEEEYRCCIKILGHIFPNRELNLETLRSIAKDVDDGSLRSPVPDSGQRLPPLRLGDDQEGCAVGHGENFEPTPMEVIDDLHGPLGYLMKDSLGKYRYISAHSEIPFNAAVCSMSNGSMTETSSIIRPPKVGSFPPSAPSTSPSLPRSHTQDEFSLPPRDSCDIYVSRFFSEVHGVYWFYSTETFHARLDETYSSRQRPSSSWLCSLYAIFAVAGIRSDDGLAQSAACTAIAADSNLRTSQDYMSLAKDLVSAVYDEADLDSLRALAILSIACENSCFRVTSYLYIGAAIQIAYSLGLHHDKLPTSGNHALREQNRRVWWTLFILDQEIASRNGSPCLIDERTLKMETPLPSEQMLYPGMHTPLGWLSTSVSLCRLKRDIIRAVYPEQSAPGTVSSKRISELQVSLQQWYDSIPPHLQWGVAVPLTQKRAIVLLHINYWSTNMLLSRPFLLYLVSRNTKVDGQKRAWFENLADRCIDAAGRATVILQQMAKDRTLSSLTTLDSSCILRVIMVFILALALTKEPGYKDEIEACLNLLRNMEQIGFCKVVAEETPMRVADLGMLPSSLKDDQPVELDDDLIAQLWGSFHPNFMTPMQNIDNLNSIFGDSVVSDLGSEPLTLTSPNFATEPNHLDGYTVSTSDEPYF